MPLKYPLHHYDEGGRLKPPLLLYIFLLFVCRGFLLLVISLSFREDSDRMMSLFFPSKFDFYWSLLPTLPALCLLALLSQRTTFWEKGILSLFRWIVPMFVFALVLDVAVQISILWRMEFQFSLTHGASIFVSLVGLAYANRSRHIQDLPSDWAQSE